MGELHAKVPMVAIGDPAVTAGKIEIAEHNAGVWTTVRERGAGAASDGSCENGVTRCRSCPHRAAKLGDIAVT
jgi:hypothetical protein